MDDQPVSYDTYETMAERYAEVVKTKPHNAYLERPALRALVPALHGGRVLDAGCGAGINLLWLLEQGAGEVVGVDYSQNMIQLARQAAPSDQIRLYVADLNQPLDLLSDQSFDLVYSSLVMHYIADQYALFAEFARILRPGGYFVFSTHHPYADHLRHGGSYFETRLLTEEWKMGGGEPYNISFYRRPLDAITDALAQAGFLIERLTEARPTADYAQAAPESYARQKDSPSFLCIRACLVRRGPSGG